MVSAMVPVSALTTLTDGGLGAAGMASAAIAGWAGRAGWAKTTGHERIAAHSRRLPERERRLGARNMSDALKG